MNIIVAGASRGIGEEVVKRMVLQGGHQIVIISRNMQKLGKLSAECSQINPEVPVIPFGLDLGKNGFKDEVLHFVKDHLGEVDVLLYNAGLLVNKPFPVLDDDDFERSFNVNVKGAFLLVQALMPLFTQNAHILTISSMGGYQGSAKFAGLSLYSASKGALAILTECLAEELRDRAIKCNCLALGAVQTEMLAEAFPGYRAPLMSQEMAEFIADFAVRGHRYFNGKILPVSLSTP